MNRILKDRKIRFEELPEDFDISLLPKDVEIILDSIFEEVFEEEFWKDEED